MTWKVFSHVADYARRRDILVADVNNFGQIGATIAPITIIGHPIGSVENGEASPDPTISGTAGQAILQAFLDHAWEIGLRPKDYRVETTAQVDALQNHLGDMRALVFKKEPKGL